MYTVSLYAPAVGPPSLVVHQSVATGFGIVSLPVSTLGTTLVYRQSVPHGISHAKKQRFFKVLGKISAEQKGEFTQPGGGGVTKNCHHLAVLDIAIGGLCS
eukprot:scpid108916/ scgid8520/ 